VGDGGGTVEDWQVQEKWQMSIGDCKVCGGTAADCR